jgi:hypothetical protein
MMVDAGATDVDVADALRSPVFTRFPFSEISEISHHYIDMDMDLLVMLVVVVVVVGFP